MSKQEPDYPSDMLELAEQAYLDAGEALNSQAQDEYEKAHQTAKDRLIDAMEEERADREYQLSKYSEQELKDELLRRKPF